MTTTMKCMEQTAAGWLGTMALVSLAGGAGSISAVPTKCGPPMGGPYLLPVRCNLVSHSPAAGTLPLREGGGQGRPPYQDK